MSREPERGLIVNADDFGLSPGINRGIVEGFREGILSSTTAMVNMAYFDDAVAWTEREPGLRVGIHLTLLWGRPLSPPETVASLVDAEGRFPRDLGTLARRYYLGRIDLAEVARELRAQIERFRGAGLTPTHVDTHKHVHSLPGIRRTLLEVAREADIERVRLPEEGPAIPGTTPPPWGARWKTGLIGYLVRGARKEYRQAGIRHTGHFLGIRYQNCLNSTVIGLILSNLAPGVTELMCHPGYEDEPMRAISRVPPFREQELAALKDPWVREQLDVNQVRLMHYGEL